MASMLRIFMGCYRYDDVMEFLHRASVGQGAIALLAGAWNPPTRAHVEMLVAALAWAGEGVLVLPRVLPHKQFMGVSFAQRAEWISRIAAAHGLSAAICDGGLFIEMARECRAATGAGQVYMVCGRDAAERIVGWEYGAASSIQTQLDEYQMLVAPRAGPYLPPAHLAARVHHLTMADAWHEVSSTEVRKRLSDGTAFSCLVPDVIAEDVRAAY